MDLSRKNKHWQVQIKFNGKSRGLGFFQNEKEAARTYDEQATLFGKPVNFPLHEGQKQAVKAAPKGKAVWRKKRSSKGRGSQEASSSSSSSSLSSSSSSSSSTSPPSSGQVVWIDNIRHVSL